MARALLATAGRAIMYHRRIHSSAALSATKGRGRGMESAPTRDGETEELAASAALNPTSTAWVPDPATGYYQPADGRRQKDAAEMRERLLSRK